MSFCVIEGFFSSVHSSLCRCHVNIVSNLLLAINKRASITFGRKNVRANASSVFGVAFLFFPMLYSVNHVQLFFFFRCLFSGLFVAFVSFIAIPFRRQSIASDEEIEHKLLCKTSLSREDQNRKAVRDYLLKCCRQLILAFICRYLSILLNILFFLLYLFYCVALSLIAVYVYLFCVPGLAISVQIHLWIDCGSVEL